MWLSWQTSCLSNLDDAPFLHSDSPQSWVLCQRVSNHLEELHRSPLKLARWGNHLQRWLGHQCHNWTMHWQIWTEVQCACYKYALPLETYIYEWVYWYFVFMDVHVYSCPRLSGHMMGETWLFLQERDSSKIIFISSFFIPCHFSQRYAKMICLWQHQKQMQTCKNLHISLPGDASCKISVFHWTKFGAQGKVLSAIDIISFNRIWSQVSTQTLLCIFDMLIHPVGVVMVITPIFTPSKV